MKGLKLIAQTTGLACLLTILVGCQDGGTQPRIMGKSEPTINQSGPTLASKELQLEDSRTITPSLGINVEEPQPESDEVGGQPVPFVDVFRIARPFLENYSCPEVIVNEQGWVSDIPTSCESGSNELLRSAVTSALRRAPAGSVPEGQYTVLYDGVGTLKFSGISRVVSETSVSTSNSNASVNGYLIDVSIEDKSSSDQIAGLRLQITDTDSNDPIRNIRIVMPGSACRPDSNADIWLTAEGDCEGKETTPFAEILAEDRNAMLFNPDYLRELKPYKTIRMMNLIKASPRSPACPIDNQDDYKACLYMPLTWDMRAKMDDAVWGGSSRTSTAERYGRGVPIEVLIALVNTLDIDPWFTIPHSATDDYITEFASLVKATLSPNLKPYIEYSNETWNDFFWATKYVREKGQDERLGLLKNEKVIGCPPEEACNPYWAGALYTAKRSKELFILWESIWELDRSFVRVLAGYTPNIDLTINMLNYDSMADYVDVFAVAPYFAACRDRIGYSETDCPDHSLVPQSINELASSGVDQDSMVDALFTMVNNSGDRYGLDATIGHIAAQVETVSAFDVRLYAYEGGQHLVVNWDGFSKDEITLTEAEKIGLRDAVAQANRDPRMKDLYIRLLNGWKEAGGELFTLYTMPQGFHRWGNFGIKDGLNATREESPKYDGAMTFQEQQIEPWFSDITIAKGLCNLDIDKNSSTDALSDGLVLLRYLFGFRNTQLISDILNENSRRNNASDIEAYIVTCLSVFDIDADGKTEALSDGLLVLRYLFEFRGDSLVKNAVSSNAVRNTANDIENYLSKMIH